MQLVNIFITPPIRLRSSEFSEGSDHQRIELPRQKMQLAAGRLLPPGHQIRAGAAPDARLRAFFVDHVDDTRLCLGGPRVVCESGA